MSDVETVITDLGHEVTRLTAENAALRAELAQLRATRAAAYGAMRIQGDQLRAGRAE